MRIPRVGTLQQCLQLTCHITKAAIYDRATIHAFWRTNEGRLGLARKCTARKRNDHPKPLRRLFLSGVTISRVAQNALSFCVALSYARSYHLITACHHAAFFRNQLNVSARPHDSETSALYPSSVSIFLQSMA